MGIIHVDNSFSVVDEFSPSEMESMKSRLTYDNAEVIMAIKQSKLQLGFAMRRKNGRMIAWHKHQLRLLEPQKRVCWFNDGVFPTGLLDIINEFLESKGVKFSVKDHRVRPKGSLKLSWKTKLDPRHYQSDMIKLGVDNCRGVFESAVGCHERGQGILMFNGSIKEVQDVVIGDVLMGPDSTERVVLELHRGHADMVRIIPTKGTSFVVNSEHILSLQRTKLRNNPNTKPDIVDNPIVNITVKEYLQKHDYFRLNHKLYRVGVDFKEVKTTIPPYILGLWLGDGSSAEATLTTMDDELADAWVGFAKTLKDSTVNVCKKPEDLASTYKIQNIRKRYKNPGNKMLKDLSLINNKHIPNLYKINSEEVRLELLAGLIDSDGYLGTGCYDIIQKNPRLAKDIVYLARSLGFAAYSKACKKRCVNNGVWGDYHRISISGHLDRVPTRLSRKQSPKRKQKKCVMRTGLQVECLGTDDYFGFSITGDSLYLMDDFTVTHNSGKSLIMQNIIYELKVPSLIVLPSKDLAIQTLDGLDSCFGKGVAELITTARMKKDDKLSPIRATTIQTLSALKKKAPELLKRLLDDIDLVFIDEVHHCLQSSAKIQTDQGIKTIGQIVKNRLKCKVLSYNESLGKYEYKPILNYYKYKPPEDLIKLTYSLGKYKRELLCTANHKVWTNNRGYVVASELTLDDDVEITKTTVCECCDRMWGSPSALSGHLVQNRRSLGDKQLMAAKMREHPNWNSEKARALNSASKMGSLNPAKRPEVRKKMSESSKKSFEAMPRHKQLEQIIRFQNAPIQGVRKGPTKLESRIINLCIDSLEFTGDGAKWLTSNGRHMNPDFLHITKRVVIEVGDIEYWHKEADINERVALFKDIDYRCLYLTNVDLTQNTDAELTAIIKDFING